MTILMRYPLMNRRRLRLPAALGIPAMAVPAVAAAVLARTILADEVVAGDPR